MFDFLQKIDQRVYERYLTLERNIKSGANSFYDAYLDLQEQFVRFVLVEMGLDATARETCGALLKREDALEAFKSIGVDDYAYAKMGDYALKVNAHKHKGEKTVQIETIVNYLRVFYNAVSTYAQSKSITVDNFDANYYISIFAIFEKENADLKNEMELLREELATSVETGKLKDSDIAAYRSLLSVRDLEKLSMEEQNRELQRQISKLKDIKLASMEDKLNQTIDLLLELKPAIMENRVVMRAIGNGVGRLICGGDNNVDKWLAMANKENK